MKERGASRTRDAEKSILLAAARDSHNGSIEPGASKLLRRVSSETLDWRWLLGQAKKHGIEPILKSELDFVCSKAVDSSGVVPDPVWTWLGRRTRAVAFHTMHQSRELRHVVQHLEGAEVPVIPFKGPLLGHLAYGNVALRRSADLDLLVREDDFDHAIEELQALGYRSFRGLTAAERTDFVAWHRSCELFHPEKNVIVELHYDFFPRIVSGGVDPEAVWECHEWTSFVGTDMRSLAREDLIIYLCAHGTWHRWVKLKWLADLHGLLTKAPGVDGERLFERARKWGSSRMVRVGLGLASTLLQTPVPEPVSHEIGRDAAVQRLMGRVQREWLFAYSTTDVQAWEAFRFHVLARERWRDRLPYLAHSLGLAVTPNKKDHDFIALPDGLSALYYAVRPIRIIQELLTPRQKGDNKEKY